MSIFSAHDTQAADLLALAWLDDNGAPCPAAHQRPQPARRVPDTIACEPTGLSAARRPGHLTYTRPMPASWAELIAATRGRARQQLTPALMGVG